MTPIQLPKKKNNLDKIHMNSYPHQPHPPTSSTFSHPAIQKRGKHLIRIAFVQQGLAQFCNQLIGRSLAAKEKNRREDNDRWIKKLAKQRCDAKWEIRKISFINYNIVSMSTTIFVYLIMILWTKLPPIEILNTDAVGFFFGCCLWFMWSFAISFLSLIWFHRWFRAKWYWFLK